jgi:hypothetical protein
MFPPGNDGVDEYAQARYYRDKREDLAHPQP